MLVSHNGKTLQLDVQPATRYASCRCLFATVPTAMLAFMLFMTLVRVHALNLLSTLAFTLMYSRKAFVSDNCVADACRVDTVQQALVSFTGIPICDQIIMCHGARLDPTKTLAQYGLPVVSALIATTILCVLCCTTHAWQCERGTDLGHTSQAMPHPASRH